MAVPGGLRSVSSTPGWQLIEARSPPLSPHTERRNGVLWSLLTSAFTPPEQGSPSNHISSKDHHTGGEGFQHVDFEGSHARLPKAPEKKALSLEETLGRKLCLTEPGKLHSHSSMYPAAPTTHNLRSG